MLSQQSALLEDTDVTDRDDQIQKRIPEVMIVFFIPNYLLMKNFLEQTTTTSLIKKPSISEKQIESEFENLNLQTFHESYPSVTKHYLKISFYDQPIFQKHI